MSDHTYDYTATAYTCIEIREIDCRTALQLSAGAEYLKDV